MQIRLLKFISLILGALSVALVASGCGFKSASPVSLARLWPKMNLVTAQSFDEMGEAIGSLLQSSQIEVFENAPTPVKAPTLTLNSSFNYHTSATLNSISARFYHLSYRLSATLKDAEGKVLWQRDDLEVARDILLQPNEIFEASSQVNLVRREMCQEMAYKLIQALLLKYESKAAAITHANAK